DLAFDLGGAAAAEIAVRPRVCADGVATPAALAQLLREAQRALAQNEERGLGAVLVERVQDGGRERRMRTVVECQHDLAFLEEVMVAILEASEARPARGVDLDRAGHAERIRSRLTFRLERPALLGCERRRPEDACRRD